MSKRNQQAQLNRRSFKKSTNPLTRTLYKDGFCLAAPEQSEVAFFHDMREANIATPSGRYFKNSKELEELRQSNRGGLRNIGDKEINKLSSFLAREFSEKIPDADFEYEFDALCNSWSAATIDLFRQVIGAALPDDYNAYDILTNEDATLDFIDNAWCINITLSNIRLKNPNETVNHALAGEIKTRYTLRHNSFMLDQFEATTPFLNVLCFHDQVFIDSYVLQEQSDEVTFDSFIAAFENRLLNNITDPAEFAAYRAVLNEMLALKSHAQNKFGQFASLNKLLEQTLSFMDGAVDASVIESYQQTAAEFNKTSFGKKLAIALTALAGFLLASVSLAAHVITAGAAAPCTIPGMLAGATMFSTSCFSFYRCWQKKSLERATQKLMPFVSIKPEATVQPKTTAQVHAHVMQRVHQIDKVIRQFQKR